MTRLATTFWICYATALGAVCWWLMTREGL